MNDFEPEWYNRLKGSPVNRRTFTSDHMEEIQQKASRLRAVNIQKQRARRTRWMMAAAAAFAIIAGLTLYHSKLGSLASEYWKEITVRHVLLNLLIRQRKSKMSQRSRRSLFR